MENELITAQAAELALVTAESQAFELLQRQAKMLSASTLVPKEFQGNMANCAIGLNIAKRLGADPFMVLQNIDIIHGRPAFRATFLIAMVNASGRFSPIKFREDGTGDGYGVTAYATEKATGESVEGPKVDWHMVKAEKWHEKPGSKWKTMPQLMFRYRAAALFARLYAPDITLGIYTSEEAEEMPAPPRQATGRVLESAELPASPTSNPFERPAPAKAEKKEKPREEPKVAETLPLDDSQTCEGTFLRYETVESPESAKKPWVRHDLFMRLDNGAERKLSTFSASVAEPLEWLAEGDRIVAKFQQGDKGDTLLEVRKGGEA